MKSTLPRALQPWREWLDWFAPDLASVLGELVLRLDKLAGQSQSRAMLGRLEPDGIDDLRQRGTYDRLLLSEWVLAEAVPEEFIRRAASNEHLFLSPRLVTRHSESMLVAVFDTGPAQLGAPRLVHLALLILLARRAQAARARFAWGLWHAPGELHAADTPARLMQFLRARSWNVAGAEEVSRWQEALAGADLPPGERWLIGARPDPSEGFDHVAAIRRGFDDRLHLAIGTQRARRTATLDLPKSQEGVSILKGDFIGKASLVAKRRSEGRFSLKQPPLFSASGSYVAVALAGEHRVALFKIQDGDARKQLGPRYAAWPPDNELAAAVLSEKVFGGVIADATHLHFWQVGKFRVTKRPPPDTFSIIPGQRRWLPAVLFNSGSSIHCVLALDSAGHLVRWWSELRKECDLVSSDVFGIAATTGEKLVFAKFRDGLMSLCIEQRDAGSTWVFPTLQVSGRPLRLFALTEATRPQWRGHMLVVFAPNQDDETICRRYTGLGTKSLNETIFKVSRNSEVVGLVTGDDDTGARLLVLVPNRRRLQAVGDNGTEVIYEAGSEISTVSCSPDGKRVALITAAGQLIVFGDGGRRILMDVSSGERAPA